MTGKYQIFKSNTESITFRCEFAKKKGVSLRKLDNLKGRYNEGLFELNGIKWSFETIYKNPSPRKYVPNTKGIKSNKEKDVRIIGKFECTYINGRLISTKSIQTKK